MNKLQINPPEGYEIDQDKSDLSKGVVFFKESKKVLNYEDVAKKLFYNKDSHWINGECGDINNEILSSGWETPNVASSKQQLESILALNKLCNVAKYLNGDWLPEEICEKYSFHWTSLGVKLICHRTVTYGLVYFKTKELAEQAISILGEDEIRKALTLNH